MPKLNSEVHSLIVRGVNLTLFFCLFFSLAFAASPPQANHFPLLASIGNKEVAAGSLLAFTLTATDPDIQDKLEFYLFGAAPTGAGLNKDTGAFNWTPTTAQIGQHIVIFVVTDGKANGSEAIFINVKAATSSHAPTITTQPQSQTINIGSSVTFSITATGTAPLTYQWQKKAFGAGAFTNISAATSTSYTFTPFAADNGAQFRCTVTNSVSSVTSSAANLTVNVTLTTNAQNGTVTRSPQGTQITGGYVYPASTVVTLTATPGAGYLFTSWSGGVTGSTNPVNITLDANKTVTANFTLQAQTLAAPSNLTTTVLSTTEIRLYWQDNSNNEDGFKIEYGLNPNGPFNQIGVFGAGVTTCRAYNLTSNTTYYYRIRAYNSDGNSSYTPVVSATTLPPPDTTVPTGSIKINNGASYTNSASVTLQLQAQDNPGGSGLSQMRFSNDSSLWSNPEPYASAKSWALSLRDGAKTVYVKFSDNAGNWSQVYSASITLDTALPSGTIKANSYTTSPQVTLNLQAQDYSGGSGLNQMRFSNDNSAWTDSERYVSTKSWTLTSGDGSKTVYVKFSDVAGNWSVPYPCVIVLDTTPPAIPVVTDDGASTADASQLHCSWSSPDPESGITEYYYRISENSAFGSVISGWTSTGASAEVTKTGLNLTVGKTYYFSVRAKNGAGLWSKEGHSDGIIVTPVADTTAPTGSIKISIYNYSNSNDSRYTNSTSVILQLQAQDNPGGSGLSQMRFSNDNLVWTDPELYYFRKNWTLSSGDGAKIIYAQFNDKAGNWSGIYSYTIVLDTTPPTIPIVTDDGDYTSDPQFSCYWSCLDLDSGITKYKYKISRDSPSGLVIVDWEQIERMHEGVSKRLINLNIGKTYYFSVKARNGSGLWSEVGYSNGITFVAVTPPTGSIKINNGSLYTTSTQVTLNLQAQENASGGGVSRMRFSNDNGTWSNPEPYTAAKNWALSPGDGTKTVYVQFSDRFGTWSISYQSTITLDTSIPAVSVKINNNASYTNSAQVSLYLEFQEDRDGTGISQIRFSNDNSTWSIPEPESHYKTWTLPAPDGNKTIYVKVSDRAGNWSQAYPASIILDTAPPSGSIKTNNYTTSPQVTLNLQAQDYSGGSGLSQMRFSNNNSLWSDPEPYTSTKNWVIPTGNGAKTVYVKFSDLAGNWSAPYPCVIVLDTAPPEIPVVTDDGASTSNAAQLHCKWSSLDPESGITEYYYRISENSPFGSIIAGWTSAGTSVEVTKTGLNLTPGKTYYFSVRAKNGSGLWSEVGYSDGIRAVNMPPLTPANLIATALSTTEIRLNWQDNSNNEDGFRIERGLTQAGPFSLIDLKPENSNTCVNAGLQPRTAYYYRIKAYNSGGESGYSGVASTTTLSSAASPRICSFNPSDGSAFTEGDIVSIFACTSFSGATGENQILVDGKPIKSWFQPTNACGCQTTTGSSFSFGWQTKVGDNGDHTIEIQARNAGAETVSVKITVFIYRRPPGPPQ